MKLIQIIAWRDGILALDSFGGLWFAEWKYGTPNMPLEWRRLNLPDSLEMGEVK